MQRCSAFPAGRLEAVPSEGGSPSREVPIRILAGSPRTPAERRSKVRQNVRERCRTYRAYCAYCINKPAQRHRITALFSDLKASRRGRGRLAGALGRLPLHEAMQNDRSTEFGNQSGQSNQISWSFGIRTLTRCYRFLMASMGWVAPACEPGSTDSHFNRSFQFHFPGGTNERQSL